MLQKEGCVVSEGKPAEISDVMNSETVETVAFNPERNYLALAQQSRSPRDVLSSGKPAVRYVSNGMKHYRSRNYD